MLVEGDGSTSGTVAPASDDPSSAVRHVPHEESSDDTARRVGFWLAIATAGLTVVTFGFALTAIPNSGRNCRTDCAVYPFTSDIIVDQFPGDYLWMIPAMLLMVAFVGLVACIHQASTTGRKVFSLMGLSVAVIASAILITDYFMQLTVMQPNLSRGQIDGWAMLTQYNPNGVFIALEELGFLLMSVVFLALAPVFAGPTRAERALRWLFRSSFTATVAALTAVSVVYGFDRQDSFEIVVISLVWLTLIGAGPLLAVFFKRAGTSGTSPDEWVSDGPSGYVMA